MAFAQEVVPERAAVPVRIEIVAEMALTAVGKIAKAELRMRAAGQAYRAVLADAEIDASVRVRTDLQLGAIALVKCAHDDAQRVRELLGRFPLPVYVSPAGGETMPADKVSRP
jgi:fatty-acyl-CoA synthase